MPRSPKPLPEEKQKRRLAAGDTRVHRQTSSSPRLPHERDESADSQADAVPSQRDIGLQAHEDLERGLVDTGRKPVADEVYDENLRRGGGGESEGQSGLRGEPQRRSSERGPGEGRGKR